MLTPEDLATIQVDLAGLAADAEQAITYRVYAGIAGGDPVLGIPGSVSYADQAATVTARELTVEEVLLSAGAYTIGDVEFGVRRASVDPRDLIVYGGATWRPQEIRKTFLGGVTLVWRVRCKHV